MLSLQDGFIIHSSILEHRSDLGYYEYSVHILDPQPIICDLGSYSIYSILKRSTTWPRMLFLNLIISKICHRKKIGMIVSIDQLERRITHHRCNYLSSSKRSLRRRDLGCWSFLCPRILLLFRGYCIKDASIEDTVNWVIMFVDR